MKTTLHFHAGASQCEASNPKAERTYSLLEAAQVMDIPLSDLREILKSSRGTKPGGLDDPRLITAGLFFRRKSEVPTFTKMVVGSLVAS